MLRSVESKDGDKVKKWISTGREDRSLLSYGNRTPSVSDFAINFKGHYLAHEKQSNFNKDIANFYIVYKFDEWPNIDLKYPFCNGLFGSVNSQYSGRGISFDSRGSWSHEDGTYAVNVFIFGTDNSNSRYEDNKKADFTVLGLGSSQFLENKNVYAESKFKINFTKTGVKFVMSLHYNSDKSYLFVNGVEIYKFKALDNLNLGILTLGAISKDYNYNVYLYGSVYEFSVDNREHEIEGIKTIHSYLMKKHKIN